MKADEAGMRWWLSHQGVRFFQNTLASRNAPLCKNINCLEYAWQLYNYAVSFEYYSRQREFVLMHSADPERARTSFDTRDAIRAQIALLSIAKQLGLLQTDAEWEWEANAHLASADEEVASLFKHAGLREISPDPTLLQVQATLRSGETVVGFMHTLECRSPLIWKISKNAKAQLTTSTKQQSCTSDLKSKIQHLRAMRTEELKSADAQKILMEIRDFYLNSIVLPRKGNTLLLVVDELMTGIPFEILPLLDGSTLGKDYSIAYVPNPGFLTRDIPSKSRHESYVGVARDNHGPRLAHLSANAFIEHIAKLYDGTAIKEASLSSLKTLGSFPQARFIHYFTHTVYDGRTGSLGLSFGDPSQDGTTLGSDSVLNGPQLDAEVILISACDPAGSGLRETIPGEAYSALTLSMLAAGASQIVLPRRPVREDHAAKFADLFLANALGRGLPAKEAVRLAATQIDSEDPNQNATLTWIVIGR